MGGPSSSYTTTGIALRITWPRKPHHYMKVGILGEEGGHYLSLEINYDMSSNTSQVSQVLPVTWVLQGHCPVTMSHAGPSEPATWHPQPVTHNKQFPMVIINISVFVTRLESPFELNRRSDHTNAWGWPLPLLGEYTGRKFRLRTEVTHRKLYNEQHHDLHSSPNCYSDWLK
jgi:hypothetical protein